jgi:NAD(P)-dependent dehydrogenase (short-subunit alcohol dehydrogenase family)
MNILITGGASGLGEAITRKLAENKENTVYFTYSRSEEKANRLVSEFSNTRSIKCDFSNTIEIQYICDQLKELDLDVLINNAYQGKFIQTYFHKTNSEDFKNDFEENIIPTLSITQAAILAFRKKKRGKIITILSAALLNNPPIGASIYVANKAYIEQMTKVWASENSKFNITSNSISPSFMLTGMTNEMDERIVEQIIEKHPLKKLLTKEEVANTVEFLTKASQHINGVNIVMNAAESII